MNCCSLAAFKYDKTVMCQGRNPTTDGSNSPNWITLMNFMSVVKLKATEKSNTFSKVLTGVAADNVWIRMK